MSEWAIGYASGVFSGLVIGFVAGRKREPWSELSDRQKKVTVRLIAAGVVLLAAGIIVFFLVNG
ncbi:hypothetical protein ACFLUO_05740 [Chloroflexota bacterium]